MYLLFRFRNPCIFPGSLAEMGYRLQAAAHFPIPSVGIRIWYARAGYRHLDQALRIRMPQ